MRRRLDATYCSYGHHARSSCWACLGEVPACPRNSGVLPGPGRSIMKREKKNQIHDPSCKNTLGTTCRNSGISGFCYPRVSGGTGYADQNRASRSQKPPLSSVQHLLAVCIHAFPWGSAVKDELCKIFCGFSLQYLRTGVSCLGWLPSCWDCHGASNSV